MVLFVSESDVKRQTALGLLNDHPYYRRLNINMHVCSCFNAKAF